MNLIDCLFPEEKKRLIVVNYKKNAIIKAENDICEDIGIIINGTVSISSFSFEGKEVIYNTLKSEMLFGNNLIFSSSPYFKGNVIAKSDCKIAFLNKNNLKIFLKENDCFMEKYLMIQSDFGKGMNNKIKILSFDNAEDRICYFIYSNGGNVSTTITNLAKEIGLSRETVSRNVSKLIKENKIKKNNRNISLI